MTSNLNFYLPTKAYFGKGQIAEISMAIPKNARILLTYGGGSIKKNGVFEQVQNALKDHFYIEFGGIEANPEYETLMKAVKLAREEKLDCKIIIGGAVITNDYAEEIGADGYSKDAAEAVVVVKRLLNLK